MAWEWVRLISFGEMQKIIGWMLAGFAPAGSAGHPSAQQPMGAGGYSNSGPGRTPGGSGQSPGGAGGYPSNSGGYPDDSVDYPSVSVAVLFMAFDTDGLLISSSSSSKSIESIQLITVDYS